MFGQLRIFVGTINLSIAVIQSSISPVVIDAGINDQEADALDDLNRKFGVTTLLKPTFPFYYGVTSQIIIDQYFIKH